MLLEDIVFRLLIVFTFLFVGYECVQFSNNANTLILLGKQQYEVLTEKTKIDKYGVCWRNAVENLHVGCHELTEDVQRDIALRFTNCFLRMSGHETCECYRLTGLLQKECMQDMSDRAFNAYTEFYTHTQNICFYLKSEVWHVETENTINRLSHASNRAADQMEELVDNSINLKQALMASHLNLKTMMDEFQLSASEQRRLIFDVFDRLSSLQQWAIGEISWLDTVVFYLCGVIISHILTATPRTQNARFYLFLAFTINIIIERYLCYFFIGNTTEKIDSINENLSWWIWVSRKILIVVGFIILTISVLKYQDYNIINHNLLVKIQDQNVKLLGFLERVKMLEGTVSSNITKDSEINIESDCEIIGECTPRRIKTEPVDLTPSKLPASPRATAAVLRKTEEVIHSALQTSMSHIEMVHRQPKRSSSPALSRASSRSSTSTFSMRTRRLNYDSESPQTRYNLRHQKLIDEDNRFPSN